MTKAIGMTDYETTYTEIDSGAGTEGCSLQRCTF